MPQPDGHTTKIIMNEITRLEHGIEIGINQRVDFPGGDRHADAVPAQHHQQISPRRGLQREHLRPQQRHAD